MVGAGEPVCDNNDNDKQQAGPHSASRYYRDFRFLRLPLLLFVVGQRSLTTCVAVDLEHGSRNSISYARPGLAQGTKECISPDVVKMCDAGQSGEMDYPVGLTKTFVEEACYDAQCRICTDVAWTCELSFRPGSFLERYNQVSRSVMIRSFELLAAVVVSFKPTSLRCDVE